MISNRICQFLTKAHMCRGVAPIYSQRQHIHIIVKHNLFRPNLFGPRVAGGRKRRPIFESSCCSSVRHYSSDSPDGAGIVRLLRGYRKELMEDLEMPNLFRSVFNLYRLTKLFDEKLGAFTVCYAYMAGFQKAFSSYVDLIRESNTSDFDKDWMLPEAQEDTKDILSRLPPHAVPESSKFVLPFFLGFAVRRYDSKQSVDAAFLFPCSLYRNDGTAPFFHLVFSRNFGPGVKDSWSIKNVAVYLV